MEYKNIISKLCLFPDKLLLTTLSSNRNIINIISSDWQEGKRNLCSKWLLNYSLSRLNEKMFSAK